MEEFQDWGNQDGGQEVSPWVAIGSLGHSGQEPLPSLALSGCLQPPPTLHPTTRHIPGGRHREMASPLCASPGDAPTRDGSCPPPITRVVGAAPAPPIHASPPPSSRQPCSGCPAESCSSLSRERYAVLQLSVGAGKQQGNVKNDGSLHHGSAEGLMSLCAPQGTTTLQGQPAPAASEHQVGKQHMRIEREAVESPKLVEEGCRALVR